MQNPIDILGVHPSGANPRRIDPRDYKYGSAEITGGVETFDWTKGYDVEEDIAKILGTGFQLPTKNQGTAGSCGGEAISAYAQAITSYFLRETSEKSAKAPYAQVCVPVIGGSNDGELAGIYKNQGFYKESLVPSYPSSGVAPSEAFMERVADITAVARIDAAKEAAMIAYSFPAMDIDTVARVIRDCKGIMIGFHGTNNGTWLSVHPKPPTAAELASMQGVWSHYMYGGKAFLVNGVKTIYAKQSWGSEIPNNGWQMLDENYFRSGALWSTMALIVSAKPASLPSHTFNTELDLKQSGPEITALQTFLAYDGCFNVAPTGYYGPVTAQAVLKFQLKYGLASIVTLEQLGGNTVGPATRAKLNSLIK